MKDHPYSIIRDCYIPDSVRIIGWVNLYGSVFGEDCFIGPFVEVGVARIGNRTYISSHSYVCPGVTIGDDCFIAHNVSFTNDVFSDTPDWNSPVEKKFKMRETKIGNRVRIGSGAVILPVSIGDGAIIGAGAVVVCDVPAGAVVYGTAATIRRQQPLLTEK
jgi:acetyltransferase-like isoleucine patch superfamily enzyme